MERNEEELSLSQDTVKLSRWQRLTRGWRRYLPVLVLFVAFRVMMLMTFLPEDLTRFGDYPYYYELAQLSDQGKLPFLGYWSEYPPIYPFVSVAVYQLSKLIAAGRFSDYVYLFGGLMTVVEAASLWLFIRLAQQLQGDEKAERLGWTYAVLFVPLLFSWWTFDSMTTFFILLALYLLLKGKEIGSSAALALGALTKLVPILILPGVIRTRPWRRWLPYAGVSLVIVGAISGVLLLRGGDVAKASFQSLNTRTSYETIWALIDGNLRTGTLYAAEDHLDISLATQGVGNPPRVPEWLKTGLFVLAYLLLFWKADLRGDPKRLVAWTGLSLVIFFLWSKGWSPQWQVFLFPLILLVLPYRRAVLFVLVLSAVNLMEWPILLGRGVNDGLWITVPLRTALFALLAEVLWQQVRKRGADSVAKSGPATQVGGPQSVAPGRDM